MTTRTPLERAFVAARRYGERQVWTLLTGGKRPHDIEAEIKRMKKRIEAGPGQKR